MKSTDFSWPGRAGAARWPALLLAATLALASCQKTKPTAEAGVSAAPTYYTCPMHPQVHEAGPGPCPICHMDLVAVKTRATPAAAAPAPAASAAADYTCPMHPQVHQPHEGPCPICGMALVKQAARPVAPANSAPGAAELTLTAQQVQLGNIRVQAVGAGQAGAAPEAGAAAVVTGTITADARQTASVSSRVAGRVERLYVRQTGQVLQRGAPLFSVYSEELQALQQEYLLALAQGRELGGPYRQMATATAQKLRLLGLTAAQLRQLAARGRPNPVVTYFSPQTGTVQTLAVVQGQYVAEGSPLLTLTNLAMVWVEAQLYPRELSQLPLGQTVTVRVTGQAGANQGRVVFRSPELSGTSQVALVRIELPNPGERLRPGALATVQLPVAPPTASASSALLVPQEAIVRDGEQSYVWTLTGERRYRRRRVTVGEGTAAAVPVTAGLRAGDQVVVSGAYLLQSEYSLRQGGQDSMNGMTM